MWCYFWIIGALSTHDCFTESQLSFGITELNCTGSEEHLVNCSHSNAQLYTCGTFNDASVLCQGT